MNGMNKYYVALAAMVLTAGGYVYHGYASSVLSQPACHLLGEMPGPRSSDRLLCFSPHPDDETIAAGGYLSQACRAGAEVRVVMATDGNRRGLMVLRHEEFRRATGILGVPERGLEFWGYPDGDLLSFYPSLKQRIAQEIGRYSPTVILYPHPADNHPDHAVLGKTVEEVLQEQGCSGEEVMACRYLVHHRYHPQPKRLAREGYLLPSVSMLRLDRQWLTFPLPEETVDLKA